MFKAVIKVLLISVLLLPLPVAAQSQTVWHVATTGSDSIGDGSIENPFQTIQRAIDAAGDGDTVVVLEGRYAGPGNFNLNFKGKAITVRSGNPEDNTCMLNTIIDANGQGVIVRFVNDEGPESIFEGFTLGAGDTSKGVRGEPGFFEFSKNSRPTTRRLRNTDQPSPIAWALDSAYPVPPFSGRVWEGYNPFHQPASTTDYYGSGDVNKDGDLTSADVSLAQEMSDGITRPVARADVDGDRDVDNDDVSLINSALAGGTLPGWWNSLTTITERNDWIDRVMAIDLTDEHIYYLGYFLCHHFAYQTFIHGAFLRADFPNEPTEFDGGQTVFNVPLYWVSVGLPTGHAINGILIGDDPLNFDNWRFIEPQTDGYVYPGSWNMRYNSSVEIYAPTFYAYGEAMVTFYVDESGWSLTGYSDNLETTRPAPIGETSDNRPDLWNPRIVPVASGMILFERMRDDMSRTTDIHIADLPFIDPPVGTPLGADSHFSRLLDFFQESDGTIHLLWEGKDAGDLQNVFHGKLDPVNRSLYDVTQVSTGSRMVNMARVVVTPNDDVHVFWHEYHPQGVGSFDNGIYWTKWTGSAWQSPQNLIPNSQVIDDRSHWINRQFHRYRFDVAVSDTGNVILIWVEEDSPYMHLSQLLYDGAWNASTIEVMPWDDGVLGVDISKSLSGTLHLAYWVGPQQQSGEEGRGNLFHRTLDGSTWSAPVMVDNSSNACCPRMAAGIGSEVYMVWERQEGEQVVPIWNKYVDGTWHEAQILGVRPEADAWYPTADLLPDGDLVIAWSSRSFDRVTIETTTLPLGEEDMYQYYFPIIFKQ